MDHVSAADLCQRLFDVKAFKGKGAALTVLDGIAQQLRVIWIEMDNLARETSSIPNAAIYLQVHLYPKSRAILEIRWRARKRAGDNHVRWNDIEGVLAEMPVGTRRYFVEANQRIMELNCLNAIYRTTAMRLLAFIHEPEAGRNGIALWLEWINEQITQHFGNYSVGKRKRQDDSDALSMKPGNHPNNPWKK